MRKFTYPYLGRFIHEVVHRPNQLQRETERGHITCYRRANLWYKTGMLRRGGRHVILRDEPLSLTSLQRLSQAATSGFMALRTPLGSSLLWTVAALKALVTTEAATVLVSPFSCMVESQKQEAMNQYCRSLYSAFHTKWFSSHSRTLSFATMVKSVGKIEGTRAKTSAGGSSSHTSNRHREHEYRSHSSVPVMPWNNR